MPFIDEILKYNTISVIGTEKNTGKTECLNYILRKLPENDNICVTSIGIDGESVDQVTQTRKPEIFLRKGMMFSTTENFFLNKKLIAEILGIFEDNTALGRIIFAKTKIGGRCVVAGPSTTPSLKRWIDMVESMNEKKIRIIIDGALSRRSLASPAVSDAIILNTGAAFSSHLPTLVQKTKFVVEMINLDEIHCIDYQEVSVFDRDIDYLGNTTIKVKGILTDNFLLKMMDNGYNGNLVVADFTKIFLSPEVYRSFINIGGNIAVEKKTKLIAVCVNPLAPNGYLMDSEKLCDELSSQIQLPVYDIVKNRYEA